MDTKTSHKQRSAVIKQALDRAERYGCARCGKTFDFLPCAVVKAPGRIASAFHNECLPAQGKVIAVGLPSEGLVEPHVEPHIQADRDYFAQNPGKTARIRLAAAGEFKEMATKQVAELIATGTPANSPEVIDRRAQIAAAEDEPGRGAVIVVAVESGSRVRQAVLLEPGVTLADVPWESIEAAGFALQAQYRSFRAMGLSPMAAIASMSPTDGMQPQTGLTQH
jgi:hypothetical protein